LEKFIVNDKQSVMRNLKLFFGLCSLLLLLTACPTEQNYPLEERNVHEIDPSILGTWTCTKEDDTAQKLTISKKSNYLYDVIINEPGAGFYLETQKLTGWIAKLDGKKFLVTSEDANPSSYYITLIADVTANSITILHFIGDLESAKSKEDLRSQVSAELGKGSEFKDNEKTVYKK
jgi:hypothetical protein